MARRGQEPFGRAAVQLRMKHACPLTSTPTSTSSPYPSPQYSSHSFLLAHLHHRKKRQNHQAPISPWILGSWPVCAPPSNPETPSALTGTQSPPSFHATHYFPIYHVARSSCASLLHPSCPGHHCDTHQQRCDVSLHTPTVHT